MKKAVGARWFIAAIGAAVSIASVCLHRWDIRLVGAGLLFGLVVSFAELLRKTRPSFIKAAERPRQLNLAHVRLANGAVTITIAACALLFLGIATGFVHMPGSRAMPWFLMGMSISLLVVSVLPLKSVEDYVTEHNKWLGRMSVPLDDHDIT